MSVSEQMRRDAEEAERLGLTVENYLSDQMFHAIMRLDAILAKPELWTEAALREAPVPARTEETE